MEQTGTDQIVDHMGSNKDPSKIKDFYENATVLITGGLGFIGRLTVEKILRSCPGVSKIYLVVRSKKGKTSQERLDELFNDIIFEKLQLQDPKFHTKVTIVNGDLEKENLGISDEDEKMLINEVNIVLHIAATVRFDEKLRKASYINIRAVRDILIMAKKMKNLKSMVHVSTAYSHCTKNEVDEEFYETPISGGNLLDLISLVDDKYLDSLTPSLLGKWPNTYTFTKAVAELSVRELGKGLPISIVRPSIIVTTLKEPLVGWANNYYGAIGVSCAVGLGLLRTVYCDPSYLADIVPADFTVNTILATSWAVGRTPSGINQETTNNVAFDELTVHDKVPIFNFVTSPESPVTWGKYMDEVLKAAHKYVTVHNVWYMSLYLNKHLFVNKICSFFFHLLPVYTVDAVLYILGKERIAIKNYKKAEKLIDTLQYFMKRQWTFKNNNVQILWKKLGDTDQTVFEFSMSHVDWPANFSALTKAARIYLYKDPLDTLPQARKKYFKLKVIHFTIKYLLWFVMAYFFWKILSACLF